MADLEFSNLLKEARRACGLLQRDVCEKLQVKQSTLSAWETGAAEPGVSMFLKLCQLYHISDIFGYFHILLGDFPGKAPMITPAETSLLRQIRRLDRRGYAALQNHLDFSLCWTEEEVKKNEIQPTIPPLKYGLRRLPFFAQPAAAGLGNYLDETDCEMIEIDAPPEADAVIRISGDSMEPLIHDGDKIFLQYMPSVEDGEVGIFVLNGSAYCKQLCYEGNQPWLVSLNPTYRPIQIREGDQIVTHGKVIVP